MQRKRNRRSPPEGQSPHPRTVRAAPAAGPLGVLKHAARPLKLDVITAELGPAAAVEAPAQLEALVRQLDRVVAEIEKAVAAAGGENSLP